MSRRASHTYNWKTWAYLRHIGSCYQGIIIQSRTWSLEAPLDSPHTIYERSFDGAPIAQVSRDICYHIIAVLVLVNPRQTLCKAKQPKKLKHCVDCLVKPLAALIFAKLIGFSLRHAKRKQFQRL